MDRNVRPAEPLPRRLDATDDDLTRARNAAHAIVVANLGRDPGTMITAESMSHYVYIGSDVVVKIVDAAGHTRLDREITLAPNLPAGLGAALLASGRFRTEACDVRYACFTRMPGAPPGVGLPGADAVTARRWAEQAVARLDNLHNWAPTGDAERTLTNSRAHEGFVGRAALVAEIERLAEADRDGVMPRRLIDGLIAIAQHAPEHARTDIPVHADCDWGNWLADDRRVTALLDFERARLGEPADDWVLLAATSGPHLETVLDMITDATTTSPEALRAECEVRDAAFIAGDLRLALEQPQAPAWIGERLRDLERLIDGRRWWGPSR
jgi:hypothetical protein